MSTTLQPGDTFWDPKRGCLMEMRADRSLAPVAEPPPYGHDLAALLPGAGEPDAPEAPGPTTALPAEPVPDSRETICDREDRLFPKCLDRDAEERALLAAEVPATQRHDGWTLERRRLFLERLADSCSVLEAAASVNMTRQSARNLYRRAPAFRAAWDAALQQSVAVLAETAFHRARFGTETEVYHEGRLVGHRRVHHDRLLIYLLRVRDPLNYAPIDEIERWHRQRGLPVEARTIRAAGRPDRETSPALSPPHQGNMATSLRETSVPIPRHQGNMATSPRETSAPIPRHQGNMTTSPRETCAPTPLHQGNMATSPRETCAPTPLHQGNMTTSPQASGLGWSGGPFGFAWRAAARLTPAGAP